MPLIDLLKNENNFVHILPENCRWSEVDGTWSLSFTVFAVDVKEELRGAVSSTLSYVFRYLM
jgi:hypothetical protein